MSDGHDPDDPVESDQPAGRRVSAAVYAANWKTVLAVDALMGFVVFAAGVVVMLVWNLVGGAFLGSLGLVYVLLVARRGRQWAQLRREAGL